MNPRLTGSGFSSDFLHPLGGRQLLGAQLSTRSPPLHPSPARGRPPRTRTPARTSRRRPPVTPRPSSIFESPPDVAVLLRRRLGNKDKSSSFALPPHLLVLGSVPPRARASRRVRSSLLPMRAHLLRTSRAASHRGAPPRLVPPSAPRDHLQARREPLYFFLFALGPPWPRAASAGLLERSFRFLYRA